MSENQTDTAVEIPAPADAPPPLPHLTEEQSARVAALKVARDVIKAQTGVFAGGPAPDTMDLINVAGYILTGEDPWSDVKEIEDGGESEEEPAASFDVCGAARVSTNPVFPCVLRAGHAQDADTLHVDRDGDQFRD